MAHVYGTAGRSAFAMGNARYRSLIVRIGLPMASLFFLLWAGFGFFTAGYIMPGAAIILVFMALVKFLEKRGISLKERVLHAETGAKAEQAVAQALLALPEGWHVFHDLEFPGFNIDHIVLGPSGLFLVETKSQKGRISQRNDVLLRNGRRLFKDFLNQCWTQVYSLRSYLGQDRLNNLSIRPILCFANGFVEIRGPVRGVAVLNIRFLVPYILSQHANVPPSVIETLIPLLAKTTSALVTNERVGTSSLADIPLESPVQSLNACPKCGHERTKVDDLYVVEGECPKCGVIYAKVQESGACPPIGAEEVGRSAIPGLSSAQVAMVKVIAGIMAITVLYGAFRGIHASMNHTLKQPAIQSTLKPRTPATPLTPSPANRPVETLPAVNFPLTHAVAMSDTNDSIRFVFTEDRGQNMILLFFDLQTKQIVMRACIRAKEKLTTALPRVDLGMALVTGQNWQGFDKLFEMQTEVYKSRILLRSKVNKIDFPSILMSSQEFCNSGDSCSISEFEKWIQFAFRESGFFRMDSSTHNSNKNHESYR